jgi:hypothetical protein
VNDNPPGAETLEQTVERLTREAGTARAAKEEAESAFTQVDRRLTAVLNLQRDIAKATDTYTAAYEQLKRDQQSYGDFLKSEIETLEERLGDVKKDADQKVKDLNDAIGALHATADTKRTALATATTARDTAKSAVKDQTDVVARYRQLSATIAARHAQLKTMRDEAIKARQAGQYAVAYWLLKYRTYESTLTGEPAIVKPDEFPAELLGQVTTLTDRENTLAAAEADVVRCGQELAAAEKNLAAKETSGDADIRKELEALQAPEELNRGAVHA